MKDFPRPKKHPICQFCGFEAFSFAEWREHWMEAGEDGIHQSAKPGARE